MPHPPLDDAIRTALETERQFVLSMGGFALEIPGATLVTNERIPVPRFNFAQEVVIGRERLAAFFERALDHYFQRALRPSFRVPDPVPPYLSRTLEALGFRAVPEPLSLMLATRVPHSADPPDLVVRAAKEDELDTVVSFWTAGREREELRKAMDVTWHHPNPDEELQPWLALQHDDPVCVSLVYRSRDNRAIFGVATRAALRGQGAATAMVAGILRHSPAQPSRTTAIWSDTSRLNRRLERLGFAVARRYTIFELPAEAELSLPAVGPPAPPRWRPPRPSGGPPVASTRTDASHRA